MRPSRSYPSDARLTLRRCTSYATLILFANYLLEKADRNADEEEGDEDPSLRPPPLPPFKQWLSERREIKHILARKSLD